VETEDLAVLNGNFYKIITSQNGSRILQKSLYNTSPEIIILIFNEVSSRISELMVDSYANYFCPIFYGFLDVKNKLIYLDEIRKHIEEVANSKVGTYPLQAIIDSIRTKEEQNIVKEGLKESFQLISYVSTTVLTV
jgi:hypothetical protein